MPDAVNLWSLLPEDTQRQLNQLADGLGADIIYVWHKAYYERRNSWLKRRYLKLQRDKSLPRWEIYDQIAREMPKKWGAITAKAVQHVVLSSGDVRNS